MLLMMQAKQPCLEVSTDDGLVRCHSLQQGSEWPGRGRITVDTGMCPSIGMSNETQICTGRIIRWCKHDSGAFHCSPSSCIFCFLFFALSIQSSPAHMRQRMRCALNVKACRTSCLFVRLFSYAFESRCGHDLSHVSAFSYYTGIYHI